MGNIIRISNKDFADLLIMSSNIHGESWGMLIKELSEKSEEDKKYIMGVIKDKPLPIHLIKELNDKI